MKKNFCLGLSPRHMSQCKGRMPWPSRDHHHVIRGSGSGSGSGWGVPGWGGGSCTMTTTTTTATRTCPGLQARILKMDTTPSRVAFVLQPRVNQHWCKCFSVQMTNWFPACMVPRHEPHFVNRIKDMRQNPILRNTRCKRHWSQADLDPGFICSQISYLLPNLQERSGIKLWASFRLWLLISMASHFTKTRI